MKQLSQLIHREFSLFWQNKVFVVAFLVMPVILTSVLGFVYIDGNIKRLPILVVDEDHSPSSAKLMDMLSENNSLHVTIVKRTVADLDKEMVEKRVVAIVVIPFRFEADLFVNRVPEVNCYLNMGNTLSAGVAANAVQLSIATLNTGIKINTLEKKGVPHSIAAHQYEAFHHNIFQQYNPAGNYLYFLWPGLIFSILHQLLLLATASGFSQEFANKAFNSEGVLKYTHSAGKLILVKIFPFVSMSKLTLTAYFAIAVCLNISRPAHTGVLFFSAFLLIVGTCMLGTLFSIISPLPAKASQTVMTIGSPAFSLSGFAWSSDQIPVVLRAIAEAIPLTPFLRALRLTWIQGASLEDLMPQIYHQLILATIYFLLGFLLLRKKIKLAISPLKPIPVKA